MSLSNSLTPSSAQTVKLMKMNSMPTTEELRYMLTTAKEQKKMVELPFTNAHANTFTVKLQPPTGQIGPKWSLHRGEGDSPAMWTRESIEVMMIQNKIKIDSMSSLAAQDYAEPASHQSQSYTSMRATNTNSGLPAFGGEGLTQSSNPPPFVPPQGPPQGAWGPSPISGPAPGQSYSQLQALSQGGWTPGAGTSAQQPAWLPGTGTAPPPAPAPEVDPYAVAPQTFVAPVNEAPMAPQQTYAPAPPMPTANSTFSQMQPAQQGGWVPKTAGRAMPPPVELDPNIIRDTMEELADPTTGLTYYRAFTFFLMKEFERHKKFKTKMALLVFDFCNTANQPMALLEPELRVIAWILRSACSPLDDLTRMDTGEFAVLISGLGSTEALNFSEELWVKLASDERLGRLSQESQSLAIGVSAIPEICAHPGLLIATAKEAMQAARKNSNPCSLFSLF